MARYNDMTATGALLNTVDFWSRHAGSPAMDREVYRGFAAETAPLRATDAQIIAAHAEWINRWSRGRMSADGKRCVKTSSAAGAENAARYRASLNI